MKKQLLLICVAVACVSPSIVFGDPGAGSPLGEIGYVGNHLTTWTTRSPSGIVSEKASGPDALGSYGISPPPTIQAAATPGAKSDCSTKQKKIQYDNNLIRDVKNTLSGDAHG